MSGHSESRACTCTDVAATMRAVLEGTHTPCAQHSDDSVQIGEPAALNSDSLTQSLAARLGGINVGADL